jgi:hypothetical protein
MDADHTPMYVEVREAERCHCAQRKEEGMHPESLPLPLALRNDEITEQDFETLLRIAEDPQVPGRLERAPRKIPLDDRVIVQG